MTTDNVVGNGNMSTPSLSVYASILSQKYDGQHRNSGDHGELDKRVPTRLRLGLMSTLVSKSNSIRSTLSIRQSRTSWTCSTFGDEIADDK